MKIMKPARILIIVVVSVLVIAGIGIVILSAIPAGAKNIDLSAKLSEIAGVVEVRPGPQTQYNPVNNGYVLRLIQQLQTQEQSKVRLDLSTGTIIRLAQMTTFSLNTPAADNSTGISNIELQVGKVWIVLKGGSLDVNTPRGLASVRGSYMSVWVQSSTNNIIVCCLEGSCTFKNNSGVVNLTTGQKIISSDINTKPLIQPMDQADMQDWSNNSPESASVVTQVSGLAATSTPTLLPTPAATSTPLPTVEPTVTIVPEITPALSTTPGLSTTPFPNYLAGIDPTLIEKCLSYGYTSDKMITCLTSLLQTLTPWVP